MTTSLLPHRAGTGRRHPHGPYRLRTTTTLVLALGCALVLEAGAQAAAPTRPPNIVFILADDKD